MFTHVRALGRCRRDRSAVRGHGARAVLRPQQGPLRRFDFKVLKTEHFDIYYYPEEERRSNWRPHGRALVRAAVGAAAPRPARTQPLILYAAHRTSSRPTRSRRARRRHGRRHRALKRRVVLPFAGGLAETDHVLGHELVHAFQYDIAAQPIPARRGRAWLRRCRCGSSKAWPSTSRWDRSMPTRRCGCAKPRRANAMPTIDKLDDPDFFPYRYGHAFWAYVAGRGAIARSAICCAPPALMATSKRRCRRARHRRRHVEQRVARRDQALVRLGLRDDEAGDGVRPHADLARDRRRRYQPDAGAQPRRQARRLPVGAVAVLDRHVRGRRGDRQDRTQDRRDHQRSALRQPAVPELRGRLGARQSSLRVRGAERGAAGADDRRRRPRPPRARARVQGPRRDLQPGVVAGRAAASRSRRSRAACSTCICSTWTTAAPSS